MREHSGCASVDSESAFLPDSSCAGAVKHFNNCGTFPVLAFLRVIGFDFIPFTWIIQFFLSVIFKQPLVETFSQYKDSVFVIK